MKLFYRFLFLVFLLAAPLWLVGGGRLPLGVNLPVSALTAFVPAIAAGIAVYTQDGGPGVRRLLRRAVDVTRSRPAYLALALALPPAIYLAAYALMRLTGRPLPPVEIPWAAIPLYLVLYWLPAAGEELGWSGLASDPLLDRWGEPRAGLLLGVIWAAWHWIPFVQTGNSAGWVVWQSAWTVVSRFIILWIYHRSGHSVFAAICYHTASNIGWSLFPNQGSHYDPAVSAPLAALAAAGLLLASWLQARSKLRER